MTYNELREAVGADTADEIEELREQTRRGITRAAVGFIVLLAAGMAVVLWVASGNERQNDERDELADRVDGLEAASAALSGELDEANQRLEAAGQQPAEDPEDVVEQAADLPAPVVVQGRPGRDGIDGRDGVDGAPGANGKDGGPGPKGDTGAAGVDGQDGADGTDGTPGADGAPGASGRGIVSQDCVDGDLVTTYTDGTTSTIEDSPACPNGPPIIIP